MLCITKMQCCVSFSEQNSETFIYRSQIIRFPGSFYGPWANPISTMAPASIVFPDPLFLFQTPDENDE
jgi:hypothetical protein